MIALIGLCSFCTVALAVVVVVNAASMNRNLLDDRLEGLSSQSRPSAGYTTVPLLRMQSYSALPLLQRMLQGTARAERMAQHLERAGLRWTVGQFVVLSAGLAVGLAALALLFAPAGILQLLFMIAGVAIGALAPPWYVRLRISRRRAQIEEVLPEVLDMLSRSLRSGSGLLGAIEGMLEQVSGPIAEEFRRLSQELATGLSIEEAFRELDRRMDSKDVHIAVTAIRVQREVGGNLAEILDNIAQMIRERLSLRGEIKALVSRQVFSTYALAAVPPLVVVGLTLILGSMMAPLYETTVGHIVLVIAAVLEITGFLVVRRIATSPIEV